MSSNSDAALRFVITLQYPVALLLAALCFQAYRTFNRKAFAIVAVGWLANLCYLISAGFAEQAQVAWPSNIYTAAEFFNDLCSIAFFLAVREWPYFRAAKYLRHFRVATLLSLLGLWSLTGRVLQLAARGSSSTIIALSVTPSIALSVCSILLLGTFFHRFVKSYGGTSRAITAGTNTYATIQLFYLLAGLRSPDRLVLLRTSGFALGFLAKFLIVFGLIRLFASAAAFITNETARIHHTQRIIARIAHELNTPLSEISVHAVILRNEMRGRAHSALDSLENAVQRVAAIMDAATDWKLLDTARGTHSDASTVIRTPTVTRINKLVQTAVMAVKDTRDQTVHFVLSYSGNCCVLCIESEIVQVLINILRNSYDAFVSGKGKIHITTRVLAADAIKPERVQIVVVDNGHGISADVLPRVFLDGFSTRGHNGRGHGLAVVKNLTEANDGTVELTPISDASRGTTGVRAVLEFRRVKCDLTVRS